ncbi:hypothetical protein CGCSCA4_v007782 [Colletotrichum siamense]|uniref:Uncharacterized protein n=1 Tax=Colletotrichum siamense TaxID=690259 RepID=A0A9P5EZ40_COLSI|nr:hypothetical protein CGCSCA4_v007782 [Colletotrichum siamense]KAF4863420.1 hypothetical protein CGCSCA2_v002660 [Colletotrichum siamense]
MEASRMPDQLRELVSELDRQAQECTRHDTGASGEAIEGLFTLQSQGADYARALRKLQSSIAECLAENRDWCAITIPDESLLWKVCAFSRPSARIADPLFMRQKTTTFLKLVDRQNNNDDIQGIWENKVIENWVTSDTPSALFLEIPFRGTGRVRRFALDFIDHLHEHHPVLSMIGGLSQADADHLLPDPTPKTVLEHLIVQALRHINPEIRLGFFAETVSSFRASTTAGDLLGLLKAVCANISKLTIVFDLSIFPPRLNEGMDAASWPTEFSRLITGLWDCSYPVFCHVLLLGSVLPTAKIASEGDVISVGISAMDFGTSRRRFPFHPPRPIPKAYEAPKPARSLDSRILKATLS